MNKWLKLFIIIGSCIVICGIGFVIYKAIDSSDGDVIDSSKALYKEDTIVDDFQFMSANLEKVNNGYYIFNVMVKNVSDKDYDIDSIEVNFYNNKNKKIGSMLYVMEEDKFYSLETIPINLGKNINLDKAYSIKYKINYKQKTANFAVFFLKSDYFIYLFHNIC